MANFRKSFNFRNGVQVDEDNFIVNSVGLVGIGTSVPTESLDIRGSLKVVGVATIQDAFIGVATVQNKLEVGITSFSSGIITAKTGIVTYYGDARYLQGMPTSQWVDIDVGLGYTSIYAAGNVGVGTLDPRFTFQVGGNNDVSNFSRGVGISDVGDVKIAGIATITKIYGYGIGVTGLNAGDAIATGTLSNDRLPSNINKPTGIVTVSSVTASGNITAGNFNGPLTGTASTAQSLTGTPDITVGVVSATNITASNINATGIITASKLVADSIEVPNTGITTVSQLLHVGTGGTAFAALSSGRIGVGTAEPTSEIQIRKSADVLAEIISDTGQSQVSIGQSVGVGNSTGVLRFGNSAKTFDVINRDTGNLNMILHGGGSGIDTGRFDWIYGQTNAELMSLTYDGKLGIGKTNPDTNLHVVGTSTVTGNAWFGGNVTITGTLNAGTFSLPSILSDTNLNVTTGVSTFFSVNLINDLLVDSQIGIGSTNSNPTVDLDAQGKDALFGTVGINTISARSALDVNGTLLVDAIGIGSTSATGLGYQAISIYDRTVGIEDTAITILNTSLVLDNEVLIGIGTTVARSALDFADAGKGYSTQPFLIPPRLTNAERAGLSTVAGAFIFNTDTSKFQGYTGIAWTDFH